MKIEEFLLLILAIFVGSLAAIAVAGWYVNRKITSASSSGLGALVSNLSA